MSSCGKPPKLVAIGIAPLGIISIGVVPMGVVSIGVVPMGVVSLGVVGMGVVNACVVGMGVLVADMNAMGIWTFSPGNSHQHHQRGSDPQALGGSPLWGKRDHPAGRRAPACDGGVIYPGGCNRSGPGFSDR
jgi:hypothetical protein